MARHKESEEPLQWLVLFVQVAVHTSRTGLTAPPKIKVGVYLRHIQRAHKIPKALHNDTPLEGPRRRQSQRSS